MQREMCIEDFRKKKEFLLCVDSDGCVMDTMNVKHIKGFGPCVIDEWELEEFRDEILERWNIINLYSMDRGLNRYKGLHLILQEIHEKYRPVEGLESYREWVLNTREFSLPSLQKALEANPNIGLQKALNWSLAVNKTIAALAPEELKPFEGVDAYLKTFYESCDIAIVSSASPAALKDEWGRYGLIDYVDIMLAQDAGTKESIIQRLLEKGYQKDKVLMIGDAPGDMKAADKNRVSFYPILVGQEVESWKKFPAAMERFLNGSYNEEYNAALHKEFIDNLSV